MPLPRGLINSLNRNHPLVGYRRQLAAVLLDPVERWVACATSNSQFRLKVSHVRSCSGCYRRVRITASLDQQLQQRSEPGRVVADPPLGQQSAVLVDQRDVVMVLGPVDSAEHRHQDPPVLVEGAGPGAQKRARTQGWSLL